MISGTHPFDGQHDPETRRRNFDKGTAPVHEAARKSGREKVPSFLSSVISRAMSISPGDRYASIGEFMLALKQSVETGLSSADIRVFVSYSREPSAGWAVLFSRELKRQYGIYSFVDTENRDGGGRFDERIRRALSNSTVFVCLVAEGTLSSRWVQEEIRQAFNLRLPMIPVFHQTYRKEDRSDDEAIEALLRFEGVELLDVKNVYIDSTIERLAELILSAEATQSMTMRSTDTDRDHHRVL
jgi:hypothetical protein